MVTTVASTTPWLIAANRSLSVPMAMTCNIFFAEPQFLHRDPSGEIGIRAGPACADPFALHIGRACESPSWSPDKTTSPAPRWRSAPCPCRPAWRAPTSSRRRRRSAHPWSPSALIAIVLPRKNTTSTSRPYCLYKPASRASQNVVRFGPVEPKASTARSSFCAGTGAAIAADQHRQERLANNF